MSNEPKVSTDMKISNRYGPWAVIAGASEGTGAEFARSLAAQGIHLLLVARRPGPLEKLAVELATQYRIETRTLSLDLSTPDAAERMVAAVSDVEVGLYISNAGADSTMSPILSRPLEQLRSLVNFNVVTVASACYQFAKPMVARRRGGIIIMSSVVGIVGGYPAMGTYAATKAFELAFSESLWSELRHDNVDVIGIAAPPMATPAALEALVNAGQSSDLLAYFDKPADIVAKALEMLGKVPSIVFDFVGVETEPGAATAAWRHARMRAVSAAVEKMMSPSE